MLPQYNKQFTEEKHFNYFSVPPWCNTIITNTGVSVYTHSLIRAFALCMEDIKTTRKNSILTLLFITGILSPFFANLQINSCRK